MAKKRNNFYAYFIPDKKSSGIVDKWTECEKLVKGVVGARFKGFSNKGNAEEWLSNGANYAVKQKLPLGIYFDAGTGGGNGVEVSVTDERGNSLLHEVLPRNQINRFGKSWIFGNVTNNYGELYACKIALQIALKRDIKKIFGDSKLILDYWSRGFIKRDTRRESINLAKETAELRKQFEASGGELGYIDGGMNPADLGFH